MVRLIDNDPLRGVIEARIWLDDDAFLEVHEEVEITDHPHRAAYAYTLVIDGGQSCRWHFEPAYEPAIRYHIDMPGNDHQPSERVTLKSALEEAWDILTDVRGSQADTRTDH